MLTRTIAILAVAALPWASRAADPAAAAKLVAPYLDADTIAVARLDVAGVDVDAAAERFAKLAGVDPQQFADPRKAVREALANYRKAGANELFAVFSMADLPLPGPFVLVPRAGTNDAELKRALGLFGSEVIEPLDALMFAGGKATLARLKSSKPAARPDLEAAFAATAGSAVQVAVVLGADQRKIAIESLPPLPAQLGGGSGADIVKGTRWVAVGVATKPKVAVKVVMQATEATVARRIGELANRGLDWVGQDKGAKEAMPKFADLRPVLSPKVEGDRVVFALDESAPGVAATVARMTGRAKSAAGRTQSMNNLKQMALAFHNYLDSHNGAFPEAIMSKDGKPLLSWRVAILPYLEQEALYKEFHLDEPWDSEHNKPLIKKMPAIYRAPAQQAGEGKTTYLAPTGTVGQAHVGVLGAKMVKITDGTSNTIMLVESNDEAAVEWTKPDDLVVDPKDPIKGLIGHYPEGFSAAYADGSVRFIRRTAKPMALIALFTRDGGEVVDEKDL